MQRNSVNAIIISALVLAVSHSLPVVAGQDKPVAISSKHLAKGLELLNAGDADGAVLEFKSELKAAPNNATAWFYMGEARLQLGSRNLALEAYKKYLDLDPFGALADKADQKVRSLDSGEVVAQVSSTKADESGASVSGSAADQNHWITDSQGCKAFNPNPDPIPNLTISWTGNCREGYLSGNGTLTWYVSGLIEQSDAGQWDRGHAEGTHVITGPTGGRKETNFTHGQTDPAESVTVTDPNGNRYVGTLQHGKPHGLGTFTWANGNTYTGRWKDGKQDGLGTATLVNGYSYKGEWKDGKQNGSGTATFANGDSYTGGWKDGKQNGVGTFISSGKVTKGTFQDGKLIASENGACRSACESQYQSCTASVNNQNTRTTIDYAAALLRKDYNSASASASNFTDTSDCSSNHDACLSRCQ